MDNKIKTILKSYLPCEYYVFWMHVLLFLTNLAVNENVVKNV